MAVMAEPEQQQEAHKEPEKIPWEEIKKHKSSSSLWIVVHNNIYDVTKFMEEVSHGNWGGCANIMLAGDKIVDAHAQTWLTLSLSIVPTESRNKYIRRLTNLLCCLLLTSHSASLIVRL